MSTTAVTRIAAVQMDVHINDRDQNLREMKRLAGLAQSGGAELVIFPECATTGYCFEDRSEAMSAAEAIPGPSTEFVVELCRELDIGVVFGMPEVHGNQLYNSAVLCDSHGLIGVYRKTHLPFLGIDRFTDFGPDAPTVFNFRGLRVGMLICYDGGFPEPTRCLTLEGVDLVALPTNWPPGAETFAAHIINARALENCVYFAAANRIGTERGTRFIGNSSIAGPDGVSLARADHEDERVLFADVAPERARRKRIIRVPETHMIDRIADRRPELYGPLVRPHNLPRPGRQEAS